MNSLMNKLNLMDCMEGMKHFDDKEFSLSIVDPPYGIGGDALHTDRSLKGAGKLKNRAINRFQTKWDIAPDDNYFEELKRVSKNQIIWGGNYFNLGRTRGFICWDKCQVWENFSQVEFAWTSFERPSKLYKFDGKRSKEERIHPTQKPIELYKWLLQNYAKEGDKILDTHVGSGSSILACIEEGFEYCGFEIDEEFYKSTCNRIENHKKGQSKILFPKKEKIKIKDFLK